MGVVNNKAACFCALTVVNVDSEISVLTCQKEVLINSYITACITVLNTDFLVDVLNNELLRIGHNWS